MVADASERPAGFVEAAGLRNAVSGQALLSVLDSMAVENRGNRLPADPELTSQLVHRVSSEVRLDQLQLFRLS